VQVLKDGDTPGRNQAGHWLAPVKVKIARRGDYFSLEIECESDFDRSERLMALR